MSLISLHGVSKLFGAEEVLKSVSFRIEPGDRVALVGPNGAGKSTIMRVIAGLDVPDGGTVARTRGSTIAYLPQDPEFDPSGTLYEAMLDIFREVIEIQERLRVLELEMAQHGSDQSLVEEYGHLQERVEHSGYDYHRRIEMVLVGLELDQSLWEQPVSHLSGGQRTRANLARTLLQDADVLLLDEPTNHLDIPAVEWLEGYLRDLKGAFLIVAHDRYLLDRVTKRTVELSFGKTSTYDVPYSRYLELRAERVERQKLEYEAQQEQIAKTEEFVRRFGAGQRSREARGRQKQLDRLERLERPREADTVSLKLSRPVRSGDIVLEARNIVAGYPDLPLVRLPDQVVIRRGEKIALAGPNGSGKTTLLRTLVGDLAPLGGTARWGAKTQIGYYSQSSSVLDDGRTIIEEIQRTKPLGEEEVRSYVGQFLFSGDDAFKMIGVLSGGERSRVALAKLILEDPNVLVLDEPTNHLDITSADALRDVLARFGGTMLFVSHDRYLIDSLVRQLWVVENGMLVRYDGTYTEYANGVARPLDLAAIQSQNGKKSEDESPDARIRRLHDAVEALSIRLANEGPTMTLGLLEELTERYSDLQKELEEAHELWLASMSRQLYASSA
jgi:ATP-binding cassette subfamily F protein 3